jgi:putative acetyltransferase
MTDNAGTLALSLEDPTMPDATLLVRELSAELGPIYGDDGSGAFVPADVQVPRSAFVVARLNGEPVGCGAIKPFGDEPEPTTAEVKRMFVRSNVRGRGISLAVLERLEQEARNFGYSRLVLETGDKQLAAMRLYERAGYVRIPCYGEYVNRAFSVCYGRDL